MFNIYLLISQLGGSFDKPSESTFLRLHGNYGIWFYDLANVISGGNAAFQGIGILTLVFIIAGILLLGYLIFGGIKLMLSRGDPKSTSEAQQTITQALFGFLIIFVSFWIVQILGLVLGLDPVQDIFGQ